MIDDDIGYIKVNRFAKTTMLELRESMAELKEAGIYETLLKLSLKEPTTPIDIVNDKQLYLDKANLLIEKMNNDLSLPTSQYNNLKAEKINWQKKAIKHLEVVQKIQPDDMIDGVLKALYQNIK